MRCFKVQVSVLGIVKLMQWLTNITAGYEESLQATSIDESKKEDQRGAHCRTAIVSEVPSTCSEESGVGDTTSCPSPERTREPDKGSDQCYDVLSMDGSQEAADAEGLQSSLVGSKGTSMTDSSLSEDATDWEEDSDTEQDIYQLYFSNSARLPVQSQKPLIQDVLDPMKKEMVDRLMEEFWIIFNRKWPICARSCPVASGGNSAPTTGGTSRSDNPLSISSVRGLRKSRGSGKEEKGDADDGPGEGSGEPRKPPDSVPDISQVVGFACPYRKHNPRKYCMKDWRLCTLKPLKTVARVK